MSTNAFPLHQVLDRAYGWIAAALFQGERLTALLEAQVAGGDPSLWTAEQWQAHNKANDLGNGHLVESYESYFLTTAVRQALRWLEFARADSSLATAIDAFVVAARHVTDLRNMWDHEDEYLRNRGHAQDRYTHAFREGPDESSRIIFETSAHGVVVSGERYLLGGRVDLAELIDALRIIQPVIDRAYRASPKPA